MDRASISAEDKARPKKAPNLLARGKKMPRKKRPTTGPDVAPRIVSTMWNMLPRFEQAKAIPVAKAPKKICDISKEINLILHAPTLLS